MITYDHIRIMTLKLFVGPSTCCYKVSCRSNQEQTLHGQKPDFESRNYYLYQLYNWKKLTWMPLVEARPKPKDDQNEGTLYYIHIKYIYI